MGNSQSYDVTNVHHGKDKRQEPTTTGTVKPLSDGMPPTLDVDEREKQENTSPKEDNPTVTAHTETTQEATVQVVTVQEEPVIQSAPKQVDEPKEKDEAVKQMVQEMSNIELETLERVVPMEQTPVDVMPSQSSYDKLD
ncbi:hypothetical protein TELCIR_13803 [Teladorsagia circumcincta]|uniref:Uncharacterized protein n=1 Tax=Teladorsagia circumcincta TaxID=45464 RepID=A0A2G9U300_TELCI|nr:hypothetical protein TELCIR_13803 [Teladorsagia circumcincta]